MSEPLTRKELDALGCATPGCDHTSHHGPMYLHGRCHPGAEIVAYYRAGVVTIACNICTLPVTRIAVKESPDG